MIRQTARTARRSSPRLGFTLTEVLLVLAILGVIAAMVVPNLIGSQKEANKKATKITIKSVEDACTQFAIANNGDFPPDLSVLVTPGADAQGKPIPAYLTKPPMDAWNKPILYKYEQGATTPMVWSSGPDRKNDEGNGDDINNWTTDAPKG